jgi:hypothetical protein
MPSQEAYGNARASHRQSCRLPTVEKNAGLDRDSCCPKLRPKSASLDGREQMLPQGGMRFLNLGKHRTEAVGDGLAHFLSCFVAGHWSPSWVVDSLATFRFHLRTEVYLVTGPAEAAGSGLLGAVGAGAGATGAVCPASLAGVGAAGAV